MQVKQCPICHKNYETSMNYCYYDGTSLIDASTETLINENDNKLNTTLKISETEILIENQLKHRQNILVYELIPVENNFDLKELHIFCEKVVGPHFASLEKWKNRFEKNSHTFFKIIKVKRTEFKKEEELTGMFSVIPVNENAHSLLEQDCLNATTFTKEHIVSPNENPAALYISGVVGVTRRAKGYVISHLLNMLRQIYKEKGTTLIYTRPMTSDGLRLAKHYGFNPVKPELAQAEHIYRRNMLDGKLR